jgi:hypothetical protein
VLFRSNPIDGFSLGSSPLIRNPSSRVGTNAGGYFSAGLDDVAAILIE